MVKRRPNTTNETVTERGSGGRRFRLDRMVEIDRRFRKTIRNRRFFDARRHKRQNSEYRRQNTEDEVSETLT
jgi:hypothetical protein